MNAEIDMSYVLSVLDRYAENPKEVLQCESTYDIARFMRKREYVCWDGLFVRREYVDVLSLDYYPPELIVSEYLKVYPDWFSIDDFKPYRTGGNAWLDILVSNKYDVAIVDIIVSDMDYCHYDYVCKTDSPQYVQLTFQSRTSADYSSVPDILYFYATEPTYVSERKYKETYLWDAEHISQAVESVCDAASEYNIYEIQSHCCEVIRLSDDGSYVTYGGFDSSQATFVDRIVDFMAAHGRCLE